MSALNKDARSSQKDGHSPDTGQAWSESGVWAQSLTPTTAVATCGPQGLKAPALATKQEPHEGWLPLYGGFYELGVSVEWHDFQTTSRLNWSRSFHPDSLELCLNLTGHGSVRSVDNELELNPGFAGFYVRGNRSMAAWREAGEQHKFITVEFSPRFVANRLSSCDGALHPLVEKFVGTGPRFCAVGETRRLSAEQEQWIRQAVRPPVSQGARPLWYESKVIALMAEFFFARPDDEELFCDRQKRLARERVDRVIVILRRSLEAPPTLEEIGREVGCSPFYLSRTFSQTTGLTIPQYLRKLRIERAAELLDSGKCNVTEAAMAVGYSSLSHFSQAFCQTMGCCPGLYPLKANRR